MKIGDLIIGFCGGIEVDFYFGKDFFVIDCFEDFWSGSVEFFCKENVIVGDWCMLFCRVGSVGLYWLS